MSPSMEAFLRSWLAWVEGGASPRAPYSRQWGLCVNASVYAGDHFPEDEDAAIELEDELRHMLAADDLDTNYPFDGEHVGRPQYRDDPNKYLNPLRLAWVRKQLGVQP